MRIPGLGGQVISKLGGTTVTLPGSQIYENLVSGAIDATEWVGPYNDYFQKFYEAAKFYYTGGMHEPGGGLSFGFNASLWGSLSEWEKQLLTTCAYEEQANQYEEALARNGEYLAKLINDHGVEVKAFPDEVWDSFGEASAAVYEEVRDHSALAKKIDDAFQKALKEIGGTIAQFEGTFVNQRNRVLGLEA
jgi:TRAP-type mannitol/chloroaromatic compound transport system substrate-binding protein